MGVLLNNRAIKVLRLADAQHTRVRAQFETKTCVPPARNAKLAAVAELAGAAAHELNQPLTSVSGYAELILKRDPDDPMVRKAAQVIFEQAQRMAEVVQRVGRVTRFETKPYVGQTRILDLDASGGEPEP